MKTLISAHTALFAWVEGMAPAVIPTLARLVFAGVLFLYYWKSATAKLGEGIGGLFRPDFGAYGSITPRAFEAAGYDVSQVGLWDHAVVLAGTWAEIVLPVLIVLGLLTRLAALGMIGVVIVQSYVDIVGHGVSGADIGSWFDRASNALILDQRAFWVFLLLVLVFRGAGPLSVDRLLAGRTASPEPALA
jgi:putative oxidoreductase